jgi:hypothetical protein
MTRVQVRIGTLCEAVVEGQHVVLGCLRHEAVLQIAQLLRLRGRQIVGLREVLVNVVELPPVLVEARAAGRQPRQPAVQASGDPPVVIERPVAEHLEVLCDSAAGCILVREGVCHADSFDRLLRHAVHLTWFRNPCDFEDSRRDVDAMVELRAHAAAVGDTFWPGHHEAVARPAEMRRDLLHPLKWR